ncbi:amino acid ABC transporter substrate-binding protein [Paenisporosarcina antarctica]|uniref:Amino acid ABC transporter substrate-binding protein n=1 Tax=Paenisporosarcina antarctica TaxID=417367 RepID=A0A4P6ZVM9_9BACL|nr:amino acid ABC transporter substrate-binding protein [Paenisporosarcina antarctica]QBP40283.1 amino acid ABC transporter substrate-binding protein [Paenisporosarcina antarctica]
MKKYLFAILSMLLVFSVILAGCSEKSDEEINTKSLLEVIKKRGKLVGGVNATIPGFGYVASDGSYEGMDIDITRAVAAAIFGDPTAVEFRPLSAEERFIAVQTGEVDVLARNTTHTTSRDASVGLAFAPVTFYDGQGMMVRKDSGIESLADLEGSRIAVESGTTTELNLADQMRKIGVSYEPVVFDNQDAAISAYEQGSVDAFTTDRSGLVSRRSTLSKPDDHFILTEVLSKEPLAPSVKDGDSKFVAVVSWTVYALIQAEEYGITQGNIESFMDSDDPEIRRFLGVEGDLGEQLGLEKDFVVQVIKAVGNYGELYDRHLGPETVFNLERGPNELWTNGGLMYSPPFR